MAGFQKEDLEEFQKRMNEFRKNLDDLRMVGQCWLA